MQLKSLKVFCDIVDLRSFSRAAEANGLSQSGASQTVHHLEDELGVKLIDRSKRPFVLTPEGQKYYAGCRDLVERYASLETEVRRGQKVVTGRVRIAAIYSVGLSHMRRCVDAFRKRHPQADVQLEYTHPDQVYDAVENDRADIGLVSFPKTSRTLEMIPWRAEPIVLVCAPGNRFATRATVTLGELDGADGIGFNPDLSIGREFDRALQEQGAALHIRMTFDNIENIKRAVEIDDGVALLPWPTVQREAEAGTLVAVPLVPDTLTRPLGILHRRGKELGTTVKHFIAFLREDEATHPTTPPPPRNGRAAALADAPQRAAGGQ